MMNSDNTPIYRFISLYDCIKKDPKISNGVLFRVCYDLIVGIIDYQYECHIDVNNKSIVSDTLKHAIHLLLRDHINDVSKLVEISDSLNDIETNDVRAYEDMVNVNDIDEVINGVLALSNVIREDIHDRVICKLYIILTIFGLYGSIDN